MYELFFMEDDKSDGICIEYKKDKKMLFIYGWYNYKNGIAGAEVDLKDFFKQLGITKKDCDKVFNGKK